MTTPPDPPFLQFARASITEREKSAVMDVLDSGWLTTGPRSQGIRTGIRRQGRYRLRDRPQLGDRSTPPRARGRSASGADGEVIVPTWTFAASAEVVAYLGARPVLVDVDPVTLNATPEAIVAAVTPKTQAVVVVHMAGHPMEIGRLLELLEPLGIPVVEDAAHAFPSRIEAARRSVCRHVGQGRCLLLLRDQDHHDG